MTGDGRLMRCGVCETIAPVDVISAEWVIVALAGSPVWMLCGWDCVRRLAGRRMLAGMDGVARARG
jgi:hypothetical protein